jgi:uncharacterized protein with HEPN domain
MKKDPKIFLSHILESIEYIEKDTKGLDRDDFLENRTIQDAVMRRLEIIGEAVKNLPADFKKKNNFIPWQKIAGMRDFLIHEYFGVNVDLVWQTIKKDLTKLKTQLVKLLGEI